MSKPPLPRGLDEVRAEATSTATSVATWAVGGAWAALMMPIVRIANTIAPSDQSDWLTRLLTRGQLAAAGVRWSAEVHPAVLDEQAYLFATNHVNILDYATMYTTTSHFKQGVNNAEHFKIPFYGWFMSGRGTIPVYRGQRERLQADMRAEYQRGHSILAFPEGTRTRSGEVGTFRTGMFIMAHAIGMPVVPVAVCGMDRVLATGSKRMHPFQPVHVVVGAPIEADGPEATAAAAEAFVRTYVHRFRDGERPPFFPDAMLLPNGQQAPVRRGTLWSPPPGSGLSSNSAKR